MEILRSVGKFIGELVFAASLACLIVSIGVAQFTEYENAKAVFIEVLSSQVGGGIEQAGEKELTEEEFEEAYRTLLEMCEGKETIELPVQQSGKPMIVDCNELRAVQESDGSAIDAVTPTALFDSIYYKEYDCGFLGCIQTGQLGIILSEQGHKFFNEIQIYLVVGVIAGAVIILISAESWPDRLKGLGWPLVFTGTSYLIFKFGGDIIASRLPVPKEADIDIMPLVDKIVAPMMNGFLIALVVGVVLTASGYALAYRQKRKARKVEKRVKKLPKKVETEKKKKK